MATISKKVSFSYLSQFKTSALFISLSLVAAAGNYLYYPLMARILSVEDFGAAQALIAILSQAGSLFAGLSLLTIFLVQRIKESEITLVISIVQKTIVAILVILTLLLSAFHQLVASFLNLDDNFNLMIVAFDLIVSIPFVITFGYLLAKRRFISAALLQITTVITKLALGGVMAWELHIPGALLGIGLGYVIGMGIFWSICKSLHLPTWEHSVLKAYLLPTTKELRRIQSHWFSIAAILIVSAITVILPSFDVVAARHFLSATDSGLYSAASTLSSILLFACLPVINILIPLLNPKSIRKSLSYVKKAVLFIMLASAVSLTVLIFIPEFALSLFGPQYITIAPIMWVFGINMLLLCLFLASSQIAVLYQPGLTLAICLGLLALLLGAVSFSHSSTLAIISIIASVYATILLVAIVPLYYRLLGERTNV